MMVISVAAWSPMKRIAPAAPAETSARLMRLWDEVSDDRTVDVHIAEIVMFTNRRLGWLAAGGVLLAGLVVWSAEGPGGSG
ncbi:MAG: hypothetical protein ACHRHE_24025, partial [Tepidisphaerales bacterium]